jgi:phospholipid/cholesterol/gamma-HCH transport system substrate-binding protein
MNESPNKHAVIVGLFLFLGIAFLLSAILIVGDLRETFNRKMLVVSLFDDVGGLQKGNNIWLSGVKIGTVSNLNFFGKSQVEVSMNIEKKAQQYIPKDAMVKISNDGLIGNKILVIYGGSEKLSRVKEGDTLAVEKTFTSEDMIKTLQENNANLLSITSDFKTLSHKLVSGEGTIGKLLSDSSIYININSATASLKIASEKAQLLVGSLATFSSGLNKKGTLVNELTTDTVVFKSVKASILQLQQMADTASLFVTNIKNAGSNPRSAIGVLLHDEEAGSRLKETIKNLESSSKKLDEDLEAAQHNILLRGFFKKKAKDAKNNSINQ